MQNLNNAFIAATVLFIIINEVLRLIGLIAYLRVGYNNNSLIIKSLIFNYEFNIKDLVNF